MPYVAACQDDKWHLHLSKRDTPLDVKRVVFRCRSWRHEGECAAWRGAQDYARIEKALGKVGWWTYLVFTYDQKCWPSHWKMYKAGLGLWAKMRKRISREYGPFKYIQTWEAHHSGAPHVNVVVSNENLFRLATAGWESEVQRWLMPAALACGFGWWVGGGPLRDKTKMSVYLVKLAQELSGGEVKDQTPRNAPRHFRRIRASVGLLEKPYKDPELTGRLVQCGADDFHQVVTPLKRQVKRRILKAQRNG